jgi:hypothetical protein
MLEYMRRTTGRPFEERHPCIMRQLECVNLGMKSVRAKGPIRHASFGEAVALELKEHFCVGTTADGKRSVQWYDQKSYAWRRTGGEAMLHQQITRVLSRLGREYDITVEDHEVHVAALDPPAIFEQSSFRECVAKCMVDFLGQDHLPPLDGEQTDGTLQFANDITVDFRTGEVSQGNAKYRSTTTTGYDYVDWGEPELAATTCELIDDIVLHFLEGGQTVEPFAERLEELAAHEKPNAAPPGVGCQTCQSCSVDCRRGGRFDVCSRRAVVSSRFV